MNDFKLNQNEFNVKEKNLSGRDLILHSATQLFVQRGFNGVSMREIAEASHMTKAALYYHFEDKLTLTRQIFDNFFTEIEKDIQYILEKQLSVKEKTTQFVSKIMNQSPDKLGVFHLIFIESSHLEIQFRQQIGQKYHALFLGSIETLLKEGMEKGEIGQIDTKQTSLLLFGMLYAFFHPQQPLPPEQVAQITDLIIQIFFEGVQIKS